MNEITVQLNYFHMSPRKVRTVARLLKGLSATTAEQKLLYLNKKAAFALKKLIASALDIAEKRGLDKNKFLIKQIIVNTGPSYKRFRPDTQGRVKVITKRMSHIKLILSEKDGKQSTAVSN